MHEYLKILVVLILIVVLIVISWSVLQIPYSSSSRRCIALGDSRFVSQLGETDLASLLNCKNRAKNKSTLIRTKNMPCITDQVSDTRPLSKGASVIVSAGGNDLMNGVPLNKIVKALKNEVRRLNNAGAEQVIVIGGYFAPKMVEQTRSQIKICDLEGISMCEKEDCEWVSIRNVISEDCFIDDGLHLNEKGNKIIAQVVSKYL